MPSDLATEQRPRDATGRLPDVLRLPKADEIQAWRLRTDGNLKDHAIAKLVGVSRETVNRRIARFEQKKRRIESLCGGDGCVLIQRIFSQQIVATHL